MNITQLLIQPFLSQLYVSSDLLFHTSIYEGFGITVLEAMQSLCPVLAVDIPSVREIAADTIFYTQDGSVDSMTDSLIFLLSNSSLIKSKIVSAADRSRLFSWEDSASSLIAFYNELVHNGLSV